VSQFLQPSLTRRLTSDSSVNHELPAGCLSYLPVEDQGLEDFPGGLATVVTLQDLDLEFSVKDVYT